MYSYKAETAAKCALDRLAERTAPFRLRSIKPNFRKISLFAVTSGEIHITALPKVKHMHTPHVSNQDSSPVSEK